MVSSRKGLSPYEKKYDAKLPELYQIRGTADVQYSGRAQKAQIHKIEYSRPIFLIFTSSNKRKISTVSVRKDNVASFKRQERETIFLWYSLIIISYLLSFTLRYLPLDHF